nr:unnamed protein product [Callosobruchus chinensis]
MELFSVGLSQKQGLHKCSK